MFVKLFFFDSFGQFPAQAIQTFLEPFKPYNINQHEIQSINSGFCGDYCVDFLQFMVRHRQSMPDINQRFDIFLKQFSQNPNKNLTILKSYFHKF